MILSLQILKPYIYRHSHRLTSGVETIVSPRVNINPIHITSIDMSNIETTRITSVVSSGENKRFPLLVASFVWSR